MCITKGVASLAQIQRDEDHPTIEDPDEEPLFFDEYDDEEEDRHGLAQVS